MNTQRFTKVIAYFVMLSFMLVSCTTGTTVTPENTATPSTTSSPINTTTPTITPTLTPTITPTLALPVEIKTAVPSSVTQINPENVKDLQEVARYYGRVDYLAKLTRDKKFLFIRDGGGVGKYDYKSTALLVYVAIIKQNTSDIQISDDGIWALVDNNWLINFSEEKGPIIRNLSSEIDLHLPRGMSSEQYYLSPNGQLLVASGHCTHSCTNEGFQVISLIDNSVIYNWNIGDTLGLHGYNPTFSPNGIYIAVENRTIDSSKGYDKRIGTTINIWNTQNLTKVSGIKIEYPFYINPEGFAFSENSRLIAIGQVNSIGVFDISNGGLISSIDKLCDSYKRKVIFVSEQPLKILENSDCSGIGIWTIESANATFSPTNRNIDFAKITFDEKKNPQTISYPRELGNWVASRPQFLDDNVLVFQPCSIQIDTAASTCPDNGGIVLGTDGQYYSYAVQNSNLEIRSMANPNQIYYSVSWSGSYHASLTGLDPINKIILYYLGGSPNSKVVIQDMENDRVIAEWEGKTYLSSIVFSQNNKMAAICRKKGNTFSWTYADSLILLDLTQKTITYSMPFDCWGGFALSNDGNKLITEHRSANPDNTGATISVIDTLPPYQSNKFEIETTSYRYAVGFSPDNKMIVATCYDDNLCFLDVSSGSIIYQMKTYSGINGIAFSPNGSMMATSASWGVISLWAIPPFIYGQVKPTSTPLPPTPIPAFAPTLSPALTVPLENIFPGIRVIKSDSLSNLNNSELEIDSSVGKIKDGVLEIKGMEWRGAISKSFFHEGDGVVVNFQFRNPSVLGMFLEAGQWDTDTYKRFGISLSENNEVFPALFQGKSSLGGTKLSGKLELQPNTWYSVLLRVDKNNEFYARIWEPANPENMIELNQSFDADWSRLSWRFLIQVHIGTVQFDEFREIQFSE